MRCHLLTILLLFSLPLVALSQISKKNSIPEDSTAYYFADTLDIVRDRDKLIPRINSIATKMTLSIMETPLSVGVVTHEVLKTQNATALSHALTNVSSINVQNNLGVQDYFLIRGFDSNSSSLVLLDGANEPDISLFRFYGYGFYDLYNVEQVEVLKGPAAFLYGGSTISGAVNLLRKQPIFDRFTNIAVAYGKYNTYRGVVDLGFTDENSTRAFRLNTLFHDINRYREGVNSKTFAFNPALTWNLSPNRNLSFNAEFIHSENIPDAGIPLYRPADTWQIPDVPLRNSLQTPIDNSTQDRIRFRMDYTSKFNESLTFNNKFYLANLDGDFKISVLHTPWLDLRYTGEWILDRHMFAFTESQLFLGNQFDVHLSSKSGKIKRDFVFGLETARVSNDVDKILAPISSMFFFDPKETDAKFSQVNTFVPVNTRATNYIVAPYVIGHLAFGDKVQILGGGRLDVIRFDTNRRNAAFDFIRMTLSSDPTPFAKTHIKFSPMLGLVYQDSEALRFYVNAGRAFSQGVRAVDKPEESTQFEFGYKYQSKDGKFSNSMAVYSLEKKNMAIPLQGPLQGDKHAAIGGQRSQGLELELTLQPYRGWITFINYAYTEAIVSNYKAFILTELLDVELADFSDNIPAFVPAHILNLWSTKTFGNGFGFGLGLQSASKQYSYVDNDYEIKGYFLLNAAIFYKTLQWQWRLDFKNLAHSKYWSRGFGPYSVVPSEPMLISTGFEFSF